MRCDKGQDHWFNIIVYGGCWGSCGRWNDELEQYHFNKGKQGVYRDLTGREANRVESLTGNDLPKGQ